MLDENFAKTLCSHLKVNLCFMKKRKVYFKMGAYSDLHNL